MNILAELCPNEPDWSLKWEEINSTFPCMEQLRGCPQDSIYHREGDVWIHTGMVVEALAKLEQWRARSHNERLILFASALLHDIAKPPCTRVDQGRITSRGHSQRGAIEARRILWEMSVPFRIREQICALVEYHQVPFHLIEHEDGHRRLFRISQTAHCGMLGLLARADILGRICDDQQKLLENVTLFEELCAEVGCLESPRRFASAHSRFEYFRSEDRDPDYLAHENFSCRVTMLSGLPGTGKDTWIERHLPAVPVVSLDALRDELGEGATGWQGRVVQAARERAREFLRRGEDFVWNATNLSRDIRAQLIDLFAAYHAHVRIVYVETSPEALFRRNSERRSRVPAGAIQKMLGRWQIPNPIEAQGVEFWVDGDRV